MSRSLGGAAAVVLVLMVAGTWARADVKEELRTSAKAFSQALADGDSATAHKYAVTDDQSSKMLDTMTHITKAHKQLTEAAVAKFGDEGKSLMGGPANMATAQNERITKDMEDADIQVNGDTATVVPKTNRGSKPVTFKKQGGLWKIDFTQFEQKDQMMRGLPMMEKMAGVFSETADEIKADKYKNVQEARQAMFQKMAAAMGRGGPGGAGRPGAGAPGQ